MWKTIDFNKDPAKSRDLSFERLWHRKTLDTDIEVVKPIHTPILLKNVPAQFCTNDSTSNLKLLNTRKWNSKSMDQNFPRIRFVVNQTTDLFNWSFCWDQRRSYMSMRLGPKLIKLTTQRL